jgi:hypothetical protein
VTFDYETESFVPVEDGEFVVVNSSEQNVQPIVLPRAPRFAARRDFYEYYQDYYHCPKPDAGEVHILRPAAVNRSGAGWKLQTTGLLEVVPEQSKKKPVEVQPPAPVAQKRIEEPPPPPRPSVVPDPDPRTVANPTVANPTVPSHQSAPRPAPPPAPRKEETTVTVCNGCGASIESRYAFCWKCGSAMAPQQQSNGPVVVRSRRPPLPMDDDELTVQHDLQSHGQPGGGGNSMFSWTMSKPPDDHPSTSKGSVLKLMAIGGVAFLLLALGVFGLTRSDSQVAAANSAPPVVEQQPPATQPEPAPQQTAPVAVEEKPQPTPVNPEDELKKLREKRMGATDSDRSRVFQAIAKVERQYPRDYRFPYERAKLAAKGSKANSRTEAFKALSVAAEKAISTGKANEMLSGLEADKAGDFQKLAQGRQEWTKLLTALKRKDMSLLAKAQFQ